MSDEFTIRDSGKRSEFAGGMVRDTAEGKIDFLNVRFGPMMRRWAAHLTKGRIKYPDPEPGVPNWTLAEGPDEYFRAVQSAARHFEQWLNGDQDEDHASAVYFNINLAEYVLDKAGRMAGWKVVGDKRGQPTLSAPPGTMRCIEDGGRCPSSLGECCRNGD